MKRKECGIFKHDWACLENNGVIIGYKCLKCRKEILLDDEAIFVDKKKIVFRRSNDK